MNPERKSIALFLLATLTLILAFSPTVLGLLILPSTAASSSTGTIAKVSSGLVASDPLNKQLTEQQLNESSYWTFTGDAPSEKAPYNFYEDSNGLHIGVQSPGSYIYAGFFAKSPNTNFLLVHVKVSAPVSTIPRGVFESGVYVQTANGSINYVTCTSSTTSSGTIWELVWATGNTQGATRYSTLWSSGTGLSLTEDCTIITNGNNFLQLYLGRSLVYSNSSLRLQMPTPFQVYLEPETSYNGQLLYGTFLNYYITTGNFVTVNSLPSSVSKVELVNQSNSQILASTGKSGSSAKINIGKFIFPVNATIKALDSSGGIVSQTPSGGSIFGGDVYSSSGGGTSGSLYLRIKTVSLSTGAITGLHVYILNSTGQTMSQGNSPLTYTGVVSGQTYTACVSNSNSYTFSRWGSGNTNPCQSRVITTNTTMTAYYSP